MNTRQRLQCMCQFRGYQQMACRCAGQTDSQHDDGKTGCASGKPARWQPLLARGTETFNKPKTRKLPLVDRNELEKQVKHPPVSLRRTKASHCLNQAMLTA